MNLNISSDSFIADSNANNLVSVPATVSGSTYIAGSKQIPILPLEKHQLNIDPNPSVIRKKPTKKLTHIQNVSLKFLKPPPPPRAGDINIVQEKDVQAPPAPPLHISQKPPSPKTPPPLIFHERPPKPPSPIPEKNIVIPGKVLPPPPRQIIVERLPVIPDKPQDIIIERWLGYKKRSRNVRFQPAPPVQLAPAPKNVIVEWETPKVTINKTFVNLGTIQADPLSYAAKYGQILSDSTQLPLEATYFRPPDGETYAIHCNHNEPPELVGDVTALRLVNIFHGLNEFSPLIK